MKRRAVYAAVLVAVCVATGAVAQLRSPVRELPNLAAGPADLPVVIEEGTPKPKPKNSLAPRRGSPVGGTVPARYSPPQTGSNGTAGSGDKVALLVGINNAPGSTPLEGSITDVNNMRSALLKFGFPARNIQVLTEGNASRNGILNGLSSLAARSRSNGIAVFLLATHSGQSGGDLSFATGGGGRISRRELGSHLGRVKGRLFSVLPTCYSAGYAVPGVVGPNRIAVFSSSADDFTWQLGSAGSWLVLYMVKYGLLEHQSPDTDVEGLFRWTKARLMKENAERAPIISDGISGDLVLGKFPSKPAPKAPAPTAKPRPKPAASTPAPTPKSCGALGGLFGCS